MGLWMSLVDCSLDMGPLRFVAGSHQYGNLEGMSISEESRRFFDGACITDMSRSPDGLRFVGGLLPGQLATSVMNPIVFSETDAEAEGK